jgi:broad specificity phosphatase PhoE
LDRQLAINTSEALRERTFGSWEGKLGKDYRVNFQNVFDSLQKLSVEEQKNYKLADDIESDDELVTRFIVKLREIAVAYPGKTVLVVSHGGPIRNFLMHTGYAKYGELPTSSFSNAGYIKVTSDGIEFNIREVKGININ